MSNDPTYYIIYQTTNKVNGKIYIGAHKTSNLDDGYMGSGMLLKSSIAKHGIENFSREILFVFDNKEEMYQKEKELVNEEFLERDDVYNLKLGGIGGFDHITDDYKNIICIQRYGIDWKKSIINRKYLFEKGKYLFENKLRMFSDEHKGKGQLAALSEESRKKKKISYKEINPQQGEKNSQFGTMWITDGLSNKKIRKTQEIESGWFKGRTIRSS